MADNGPNGYPYTKPRGPIGAMYTSPGPVYKLKPLIGDKEHDSVSVHYKAPAYSLAKRLDLDPKARSPGPAAYTQNSRLTSTGEVYSPKFTTAGLLNPMDKERSPGPAKYTVQPGVNHTLPSAPAHQMGITLKDLFVNHYPAPNAYTLPKPDTNSEIKTMPKYTMTARNEYNANVKNPGPADYAIGSPDIVLNQAPKYTMAAPLTELTKINYPGPPNYRHETVKAHLPGVPKYTMGIKHSDYKGEFSSKYNVDEC